MARLRVGLLGATGETGGSILEGLLDDGGFEIVALVRPSSLEKPANIALKNKGVATRAIDIDASHESIVAALQNLDVFIIAIAAPQQLAQIPLVKAAKDAGVKRIVPCAFTTVMPVGVHQSRDQKEQIYNQIKRLHLPYTIVDVGYWYQASLPNLPSGKIDYAISLHHRTIPGDGNTPSALTDLRDVGRYVARIIQDERTVNSYVFVHNELWSQNQIYTLLEEISGEKLERVYTKAEQYEKRVAAADEKLQQDPSDLAARLQKVGAQYALTIGIRGENTPEFAKYLGYLDGKALYPDLKFRTFESYVREVVDGKAIPIYGEKQAMIAKNMIS